MHNNMLKDSSSFKERKKEKAKETGGGGGSERVSGKPNHRLHFVVVLFGRIFVLFFFAEFHYCRFCLCCFASSSFLILDRSDKYLNFYLIWMFRILN